MVRPIRRYRNRKLYDVSEAHYVTLRHIGDNIRAGDEVTVTQHPSGLDITAATYAQVMLEEMMSDRVYDKEQIKNLIINSTPVSVNSVATTEATSNSALKV